MWASSRAMENRYCTGLLPFAALDPQVSAFIDSAIGKTLVNKMHLKVNWYVYTNENSSKRRMCIAHTIEVLQ